MGYFTRPLDISATNLNAKESGLPRYFLNNDFSFVSNDGYVINVHKGFISDLASIPWPFRNWFRPDNKNWAQAAVLHDFLCTEKNFPRRYADIYFKEGMKDLGTPWHIAGAMYLAVSLKTVYLDIKKKLLRA